MITLYNANQISANSGDAVVKAAAFGSIYTTYLPLSKFAACSTLGNATAIRWPGGSLAEESLVKYSLRNADIYAEANPGDLGYDPTNQKGLTDAFALARATNSDFSMVLPTRRYMTDVQTGVQDVKDFLIKLLHGGFGQLPAHLTLEIGNESSWLGWDHGVFTKGAGSYGYIANAFLEVIRTTLADSTINPNHIDINVAVQMGTTTGGGQSAVFSQITAENLRTVDYFVRHSALVSNDDASSATNPNGYNFAYEEAILANVRKYWTEAWGGKAPEMKIYDSAWNVGGSGTLSEVAGKTEYDLGVRQSSAVIEIFSQMIASGTDACAVWGAQNVASSLFGVNGTTLSYGGEAFRLMAESLTGTNLVSGKVANGQWTHTGSNYDVIAYQDDSKVVLFVTAGDIANQGLNVSIDLSGFGQFSYAWSESISAPDNGADPLDPANSFDAQTQKFTTVLDSTTGGQSLSVSLTSDYEVVRVIAAKAAPGVGALTLFGSEACDHLWGGNGADCIEGNGGADSLEGGGGNDTIFGGEGADTLRGNQGNDLIYGVAGSNSIWGGMGTDTIQGGTGNDTIYGGDAGANQMFGNDGSDRIYGGTGNERIDGGSGNDSLYGGSGADTIYAGSGNDFVNGDDGNDFVYGNYGDNQLNGNNGNDRIYGGTGNERIDGGSGDDSLYGGIGADTIYAGSGNDVINSDDGNDLVYGGSGANRINLGAGNDSFIAGTGKDIVAGSVGADEFIYNSVAQIGFGTERDVITDFVHGTDHINLRALHAQFNTNGGLTGGGTASFYYSAPAGAAVGLLIGDGDGNGVADWTLELTGAPVVTASDLYL